MKYKVFNQKLISSSYLTQLSNKITTLPRDHWEWNWLWSNKDESIAYKWSLHQIDYYDISSIINFSKIWRMQLKSIAYAQSKIYEHA